MQIVAVELRLAGGGVAGHGHARCRVLAHVAEHHGLDVHGGAEIVGDAGRVAIVDGPLAVPGLEHRLGGQAKLLERIGREGAAGVALDDALEATRRPPAGPRRLRSVSELDAAPPCASLRAPPRRARRATPSTTEPNIWTRRRYESHTKCGSPVTSIEMVHHFIVQADVEHRVHHAGHRELGAGAAGDQQRVVRVAEGLAGLLLDRCEGGFHLVPEPVGNFSPSARYALHASVVTVKPGGTGTPSRVISPRLAPLPPSKPRTPSQSPIAFSARSTSSKLYTHFVLMNQSPSTRVLLECVNRCSRP